MTERKIVRWMVPLKGHQFDIGEMPKWLDGSDVTIVEYEHNFALAIPVEVIGASHEPVLTFAEERLSLINGVGRLLGSRHFSPLTSDGTFYGVDSMGERVNTVVSIQGTEIRMGFGVVGVLTGGPTLRDAAIGAATTLLDTASRSERAHDALTILGRKDLTWPELFMLFELVESDVGGQMTSAGWISKVDATLFCRTANSYSVLRTMGRHGKDRGTPPLKPMERPVAVNLMRALVLSWLKSKDQSASGG